MNNSIKDGTAAKSKQQA